MSDAANAPSMRPPSTTRDTRVRMQLMILLDVGIRLLVWSTSLAVAMWFAARVDKLVMVPWARLGEFKWAWEISQRCVHVVVAFNVTYVLVLFLLRLPIPQPQLGKYRTLNGRANRDMILLCLLGVLTRARYQPWFPGFLVPAIANLAPFRWLLNWKLGPHSQSVFFFEPNFLDPSFIHIGKNVTIGFGATIAAHLQDRKVMLFQPVIIEDDVLIGAHVGIACGVHIKRGAVIRGYSTLNPHTVVEENEFWAGIPAVKVQTLDPLEPRERRTALAAAGG